MAINRDLLANSLQEALFHNERETNLCQEYKDDLLMASRNLQSFQNRMRVDVMVPIGKHALMPGHLYHTNEVLIGKPTGIFIESTSNQALDIVNQRLKTANQRLKDLEVEAEFFRNKLEFPNEKDAFSHENQQEIVEEYHEEAEKNWRVAHRQRVREAKLKEKEERNNVTKDEDYEAILEKLDELELMEELQEEFNDIEESQTVAPLALDGMVHFKEKPRISYALDSYSNLEEDVTSFLTPSTRIPREDCVEISATEPVTLPPEEKPVKSALKSNLEPTKKRKSLQFSDDLEKVKLIHKTDRPNTLITRYDPESTLQLQFKHSPNEFKPLPGDEEDIIRSPVDIYKRFAHCMKHWSAPNTPDDQPRSILKKTSHEILINRRVRLLSEDEPAEERPPVKGLVFNQVVGDVQERKSEAQLPPDDSTEVVELPRSKRVSRFKASRS